MTRARRRLAAERRAGAIVTGALRPPMVAAPGAFSPAW